ncbi:MAG: dihydrodipicolinate synthase family protein [Terriglobia bacterium]|jgi:4-hydroxy-tetrahydrodipicolinate synthase
MLTWLKGIIPPLTTPFHETGKVWASALEAEVDYQIACGVQGICVTGSTGEGAGLTPDEVFEICSIAVKQTRGRVPVVGGMIPDATDEAVDLALAAKKAGVDALQVTPPHYLFQPDAEGFVEYYSRIGQAAGLPVMLYNVIPWAQVGAEAIGKLIEADAIGGIKQSGSNLHLLADLLYRYGNKIPILTAVDDLILPSLVLGSPGAIAAIVTVLPKESVALYEAVQKGDMPRAREFHRKLLVVWRALEGFQGFHARIKYAMELQGRPAGLPRHPQRAANQADRTLVAGALHEAGIALAQPV